MSRASRIPAVDVEVEILRALAEGPAAFTPLLARMRSNGYADGFTAENRVKYVLYGMHKAGKVHLTRRCTITERSQTWSLAS